MPFLLLIHSPSKIESFVKEYQKNNKGEERKNEPEGEYENLKKFGRDLVKDAKEGKLDPVIGRDEEIRRVVQVSLAIDVTLWYRFLTLLGGLFPNCLFN